MFNLFKKKTQTLPLTKEESAIWGIIEILTSNTAKPLKQYDLHIKIRSLLFIYGVIDAYCQASNLNKLKSNEVFRSLDTKVYDLIGLNITSIMNQDIIGNVFKDSFLVDIISTGGASYADFLSNDSQRGGMVMTRFGSLIGLWAGIDATQTEKQIIQILV